MYTVEQIFSSAMGLMSKKTTSGVINANTTAIYRVNAIGILNMWQEEMAIELVKTIPGSLTAYTDNMTFNYISCASYYLASNLLLQEDEGKSNFFEQKYQETKNAILKKTQLATPIDIIDTDMVTDEVFQ